MVLSGSGWGSGAIFRRSLFGFGGGCVSAIGGGELVVIGVAVIRETCMRKEPNT